MKKPRFTLAKDKDCNPDRPPPVLVYLQTLTKKEMRHAVRDLIENIDLIYDIEDIDTHLEARPLSFRLSKLSFDEYAFWSLGLRSGSLDAHDVVRYVRKHLNHHNNRDELSFCSNVDVVGQDALYAALDIYLPRSRVDRLYKSDLTAMIPSFVDFIERCDLDHEQFQHPYIIATLKYLVHNDLECFARLFVYRCNHGQNYDLDFDTLYELLLGKSALKAVIDHLISLSLSSAQLSEEVLKYCAVVYGADTELTASVLHYCEERASLVGENELRDVELSRTMFYRATRDLYWKHKVNVWSIIDTGFHTYRRNNDTWRQNDMGNLENL